MSLFSVLVRLHQPRPQLIERMLTSLVNQSNNDWELVLVVNSASTADHAMAKQLAEGHSNVRVELRPEGELLAWSCNALLSTLGTWVGFIGQHDLLVPSALDAMAATITASPQAHVIYSDEEAIGTWGQISLPCDKGAIDPVRLIAQEYLQDFVLIQRSWLTSAGGFDRLASDSPIHDLHLRLLSATGLVGFAHTPQRLYQRHRDRLAEVGPTLPDYDLDGARRHLERMGTPGKIKQLDGTLDIEFQFEHKPAVTILLILGDDQVHGEAQIAGIGLAPAYPSSDIRVMFHGEQQAVSDRYAKLCEGKHYPFKRITVDLPTALNQEVSTVDAGLTLFMRGVPINRHWLKRLVDLTQLPSISVAGPSLITPTHLTDGSPWDTRGRFNHLAVAHSVSTLPGDCLLVATQRFLQMSGFAPEYPTLFAQDFTMRLTDAGGGCARTPRSQVQVGQGTDPTADELSNFRATWAGWQDPYGLHQLP